MDLAKRVGRPPDPEKRAAILAGAQRVFMRDGYGASMDLIAAEAGVSKQTIYKHFAGKEALFHEIVRERADRMTAPLHHPSPDEPVEGVLTRVALNFLDLLQLEDYGLMLRVLVAAAPQFPGLATDFYRTGPGSALRRLADYLAAQDARGRLGVPDPLQAAEQFFGMLNGHMQLRMALGIGERLDSAARERRAESCVRLFLAGHSAPAKG
jgi:TetR/AcrR family transcriptional repressor of mexJK operon